MLVDRKKDDKTGEILWFNQNIIFNRNMFFYNDWCNAGILFLSDIFENGSFKSIEFVLSTLTTRKSKANLIFDYMKLQKAIPKTWLQYIRNRGEESPSFIRRLTLPYVIINKKEKNVYEISSKVYYRLIMSCNRLTYTNSQCQFWDNKLCVDIVWSSVFRRLFINLQDNKLREFSFKFLYNLLPTRRNLL